MSPFFSRQWTRPQTQEMIIEPSFAEDNRKGDNMPKISARRQITLSIADCEALGVQPGDEIEILRHGK